MISFLLEDNAITLRISRATCNAFFEWGMGNSSVKQRSSLLNSVVRINGETEPIRIFSSSSVKGGTPILLFCQDRSVLHGFLFHMNGPQDR